MSLYLSVCVGYYIGVGRWEMGDGREGGWGLVWTWRGLRNEERGTENHQTVRSRRQTVDSRQYIYHEYEPKYEYEYQYIYKHEC